MVGQLCLTSASNRDYGIARIGTDGNLDPSFSGDGLASFDLNAQDGDAHAVALQSDGKILVAGSYWDGTGTGSGVEWALTRLNSNGTVDTSFGSSGSTVMHFATGPSPWWNTRRRSPCSPTGRASSWAVTPRTSRSPASTRTARSTRPSAATARS